MTNKNQSITVGCDADEVAYAFQKAIQTIKHLPSAKVKGYFNAWPDILYSQEELDERESTLLVYRSPAPDISKMKKTLEWRVDAKERSLIWARAKGLLWKIICLEFSCGCTKAW
ncbi:hypothetical protein RLOatenuis_6480 [Rickettsiales bacterium]|nr:hypothetical protein RLOatenuis_6480 [Rickettsiales bacterium]